MARRGICCKSTFPSTAGPNTIVVIDLGSGAVKQIQTDRGWNFHLCPAVVAPNGKLFISALGQRLQQEICTYDPATNELTLGAVDMPDDILGETHPLVLGTDGKLYAIGQHPSRTATAAQIDPDTLQVKAYGPIGPSHEPNSCWGYSAQPTTASSTSPAARSPGTWWPTIGKRANPRPWSRPGRWAAM